MFSNACDKIQGGEVYFLQQKKGKVSLVGKVVEGNLLDNEIFRLFFDATAGAGEVLSKEYSTEGVVHIWIRMIWVLSNVTRGNGEGEIR